MTTQSVVGSILALTGGEEINAKKLAKINDFSKSNRCDLLHSYDVADVIYELSGYSSYFRTSTDEIAIEQSRTTITQIKETFFDDLRESEKSIIYKLICYL